MVDKTNVTEQSTTPTTFYIQVLAVNDRGPSRRVVTPEHLRLWAKDPTFCIVGDALVGRLRHLDQPSYAQWAFDDPIDRDQAYAHVAANGTFSGRLPQAAECVVETARKRLLYGTDAAWTGYVVEARQIWLLLCRLLSSSSLKADELATMISFPCDHGTVTRCLDENLGRMAHVLMDEHFAPRYHG